MIFWEKRKKMWEMFKNKEKSKVLYILVFYIFLVQSKKNWKIKKITFGWFLNGSTFKYFSLTVFWWQKWWRCSIWSSLLGEAIREPIDNWNLDDSCIATAIHSLKKKLRSPRSSAVKNSIFKGHRPLLLLTQF